MQCPSARLGFEDYFASKTSERTVEESIEESSTKPLGSVDRRALTNAAPSMWRLLC
jgi:hypothetical protein